jgi:hypothetical protein
LREALALVRGRALPELLDDRAAGAERDRLDELAGSAEEELTEALLVQGRHRELLPELRATVSTRRFRERSWGQLMVALYRCGRQAEALEAYREARRALADELGLEPGRELRMLERMILVHDAALEPPSARERWVPPYATSFIGREAECAAVRQDLRDARLVSLVGPGGVGKTRLAAELAAGLADALRARLWWIDLGSVSPGHVVATVARMLAVPEIAGRTPLDLTVTRLVDEPALLVLDNCEHVRDEVARLAGRILVGARSARILCTSRAALGLEGELIRPLAGLRTPGTLPVDPIGEYPAAHLLLERASRPRELSRREAAAVAEVVTRLDGLPLAIELAATKLRWVPAEELARSMRERLSLLYGPNRAAPARQRSLESAIAWSHDLVSESERVV